MGDNARLCRICEWGILWSWHMCTASHGGKPATNNLLVVTDRQRVKGSSKATFGLLKNAHHVFDHDKG
jgi:hypothetical protein